MTTTSGSAQQDGDHALPMSPVAQAKAAQIGAEEPPPQDRADEDGVAQLAGALRAARHAHRAYLAELRLGDTEPPEDWSTWYAEYLLGER